VRYSSSDGCEPVDDGRIFWSYVRPHHSSTLHIHQKRKSLLKSQQKWQV
jgi:hypothetical protein